jgi:hypothetical protein
MAHDACASPLPASFLVVAQAMSTTSPLTVMSEANTGMTRAATNAAPATIEITLRIWNSFEPGVELQKYTSRGSGAARP